VNPVAFRAALRHNRLSHSRGQIMADSKRAPRQKGSATPELAVCIPVKNEADNIVPLLEEIAQALTPITPFEVIYCDDGSDDDTPKVLAAAKERFAFLRVVRHARSCGQSQAIATAIKFAQAPWIATLDGDGQNDPADIPKLLALRDQQPHPETTLIAGWRQKRRDTWIKRFSSRFANNVRAFLLRDDTPDTGCGLKLFSRAAFLDLPRFNHMHRYLPALFQRAGGKSVSVPVNHRHRERGASKYGTIDRALVGIYDLIGVSWLIKRGSVPVIEHHD